MVNLHFVAFLKESGARMFRSGRRCEQAGVYRSNDCGYEITLESEEDFPDCPLHERAVTWTFIKKLETQKARGTRNMAGS